VSIEAVKLLRRFWRRVDTFQNIQN